MYKLVSPGLLALATVLAGCASSSTTEGAPGARTSEVASSAAEPARLSGTWVFALAASDVAAPLEARCAKDSDDDTAKSKSCWEELTRQAAMEKIRFATSPSGQTLWTSFESEGARENVYVEVPVELASDGPGHVLAKVTGAPRGEHAARFAQAKVSAMRIEVIDARTIAMTDPKKGRLVYTKE